MTRATVLNVDDYLPGRYARTRVLRDAGFTVVEASNGEEALRLIRSAPPDVVLLDHNLPDIPGLEVCRLIKETPETEAIPVLQISASSRTSEIKVEAMNLGADLYLTEPIAPAELVAHVRAALRWRRAEEGLRESHARISALYEEAQRANRQKDEFLAVLSHELRTPLNAMFGWIQLLRAGRLTPEQQHNALLSVERNAFAQSRLIEDLLDVSRIVAGQLSIGRNDVDLAAIVRGAVETVRPSAAEKGLRLELHTDAERVCVRGDASRLQQVTVNLLSNAIKFTERGEVSVRLHVESGQAHLEVRDTGPGIDPAFLPFAFDRFRQEDSSRTRPHGGLGLGLSIARHLVEAHDGTIEVESAGQGAGATFRIRLPVTESAAVEAPPARSDPQGGEQGPLDGIHVLLVEDDEDSREMMALLLEHSGARVTPARNALEALEAVERADPGVMLADVGLPHMDGFALVRRLREQGRTTPAVALTGYATPDDRRQALEAGFNDHLGKPVVPETLIAVLQRWGTSEPGR